MIVIDSVWGFSFCWELNLAKIIPLTAALGKVYTCQNVQITSGITLGYIRVSLTE